MSFNFIRKYLCCGKNIICKKICSTKKTRLNPYLYNKLGYIFILISAIIYSIILSISDDSLLYEFRKNFECYENDSTSSLYTCIEISSIYRLSFSLFALHFICWLLSLTQSIKIKNILQNELWLIKILFVCFGYYGTLFISNNIFGYYAMLCKSLSLFYLLYQLLLNIYFAHFLNFKLIWGYDKLKTMNRYRYYITFFSLTFFLLSVSFIVISFFNFEDNWYDFTLIFVNILLGMINIFISISSLVENKRLLTSICIFSYSSYITWAAIKSHPEYIFETNITISNLTAFNSTIFNSKGNSTDVPDNSLENKLILDFTESLFGLIYVILALIFLGFFSKNTKKNNNNNDSSISNMVNEDDFNSESYLNKSLNQDDYITEKDKILENCRILPEDFEYKYDTSNILIYF